MPRLAGASADDLASRYVGKSGSQQDIHAIAVKLGFTDPIWVQYGHFLWLLLHGNLSTGGYWRYVAEALTELADDVRVGAARRRSKAARPPPSKATMAASGCSRAIARKHASNAARRRASWKRYGAGCRSSRATGLPM